MERPESIQVPSSLTERMSSARTYEDLLACWDELADIARFDAYPSYMGMNDIPEEERLAAFLGKAYKCFSTTFECDSFIKAIWEYELLDELEESGIPQQFLLQTVRMGAVMGLKSSIEESPDRHVQLFYGVRDNKDLSGGFEWANGKMREIQAKKGEDEKVERMAEIVRQESRIEVAIQQVGFDMLEDPDYTMPDDQKDLLRDSFERKLMVWKVFCDQTLHLPTMKKFFTGDFADKEINQQTYREFVNACEADEEIREDFLEDDYQQLPLEIVNPSSGWFYVLKKNGKTTWRDFLSSAVSNMNQWFEL